MTAATIKRPGAPRLTTIVLSAGGGPGRRNRWKTWWGVRHLRYAIAKQQFKLLADVCRRHRMPVPKEAVAHVAAVWEGRA